MNYDQFTLKTQDALQSASALAQQNDHSEIGLPHLLVAMLEQKDGITLPVIERIGVQKDALLEAAKNLLSAYPQVTGNVQMQLSSEAQKVLAKAEKDLELLQQAVAGSENDVNDTAPTFKTLEEGSNVLLKEENQKLAARQQKFIRDLRAALIRIENGTYGICQATGKLIPKERLMIVPHATMTVEAKEASKKRR